MADKKGKGAAPKEASAKKNYYSVSGDKLERVKRSCPKCGPGAVSYTHLTLPTKA